MKKIFIVIFISIICASIFTYYINNNTVIILSRLYKINDIQPQLLRYRIYLLGILPIGEAIFINKGIEEFQGQKVHHLNASAKSLNIFSKFFNGYAVLDSYIDLKNSNPIVFKQKLVVTGRKDLDKEICYDQKNGIMSIAGVRRQIFPDTQDPISAMFNFKRIDFDKTKIFEMNINTNQKNYILKGKVEQRDLSINKKIYKIILARAEISRRDKNPYHGSDITMVLCKKKESIPILIKVFASGILINAKLVDIK